jgi:restriction system protein
MITSSEPSDWKALETDVALILAQCGFSVERAKTLDLVRGKAEIDVYAEEGIKGRKYIILCECKHWKSRIPQNVVHGFRSVCSDVGANVGYIISVAGFQSGAIEAAEKTNVTLATWKEFQEAFEESWLESYFSPMITKALDPLLTYTEPLLPPWVSRLNEDDSRAYEALYFKWLDLGLVAMAFTTHYRQLMKGRPFPKLPVSDWILAEEKRPYQIPAELAAITSYREFLTECIRIGEAVITEFRVYRDRSGFKLGDYE